MNQLEGGNILEYVNIYLQVITEVLLIKPTNHKGKEWKILVRNFVFEMYAIRKPYLVIQCLISMR